MAPKRVWDALCAMAVQQKAGFDGAGAARKATSYPG
jgi:hypothetical protein